MVDRKTESVVAVAVELGLVDPVSGRPPPAATCPASRAWGRGTLQGSLLSERAWTRLASERRSSIRISRCMRRYLPRISFIRNRIFSFPVVMYSQSLESKKYLTPGRGIAS